MRVLLFLFHLVPASKCVQVIPGRQFFLSPISTSVVMIYCRETYWRSIHQLWQYHLDRHSVQPNGKGPFLHRRVAGCKQEQSQEKPPCPPKGGSGKTPNFVRDIFFRILLLLLL